MPRPIQIREMTMSKQPRPHILAMILCGTAILLHGGAGFAQDTIYISGYGNAHYMDHDGTPSTVGNTSLDHGFFQVREFSLFFDFLITDAIIASTEIEAGDNGGAFTSNYAYVDLRARENLTFRLGKFLVPFMSYNENKPNYKQHLMSQPFTAWNLAPVNGVALDFRGFGWSDAGIMAHWNDVVGDWGIADVKLAIINGLGSNSNVLDTLQLDAGAITPVIRPRDGLIQNELSTALRDNNGNKATVVKGIFKSVDHPADAGVSWYSGKWDPNSEKALQIVGVHVNWLASDWTVKAEYATASVDQEAGIDPVAAAGLAGPAAINTTTGDYSMKAWYVEGSYVPWRWQGERSLRLVARYDDVDTNDEIAFTPFDRARLTVGTEWSLAANSRLRYEWQRSTIDDFNLGNVPILVETAQAPIVTF